MLPKLVIAGTHSGVGKTTVTLGMIAALRRRGLQVQPFKCGPDFIDPTHHARAAGRPCRNLDTWMIPPERLAELFERAARDADIAVIEGVMGVFDGFGYDDETASTAQIAKLLDAPVILVLDVSKQARSAAALAQGFCRFDPELRIAGFLLNRVGSESHGRGTARAVEQATGLPVLGWLPRQENLLVPERHLGLIPAVEPGAWDGWIDAAADSIAKNVDVDRLLAIAGWRPVCNRSERFASVSNRCPRAVIAVARDEAFHFTYEENLELLESAGATLAFFSPLHDDGLPDGTQGLILSGGFPEVFAEQLSASESMRQAIAQAHADGLPIYAECGGLMYLTESIVDHHGRSYPMVGVLPGYSAMSKRLTLGYRLARAAGSAPFFQEGDTMRGHEFHYSTWQDRPKDLPPAYYLVSPHGAGGEAIAEGACLGNLLASYVHMHFWNKPEWAERFVEAAIGRLESIQSR